MKQYRKWLVAFDYLFDVQPVFGLGLVFIGSIPFTLISVAYDTPWIVVAYAAVVLPSMAFGWGWNADHGPASGRDDAEVDRRIQNLIKSCGYASEEEFKAAIERDVRKDQGAWKSLAAMWGRDI